MKAKTFLFLGISVLGAGSSFFMLNELDVKAPVQSLPRGDSLIQTWSGRLIAESAQVPAPSPSQESKEEPISKDEIKRVRSEFKKHQSQEFSSLKDRQAREWKEGVAQRKARKKEWDDRERAARRAFFQQNPKGHDRRAYIHDFMDRRNAFYQSLKDEETRQKAEQEHEKSALLDAQKTHLQELEAAFGRGLRPAPSVWR